MTFGDEVQSRIFADDLRAMRKSLPTQVKALLNDVEGLSGRTCNYHPLVPHLQNIIDSMKSDLSNRVYSRFNSYDSPVPTEKLISLIELSYRKGIPITSPAHSDAIYRENQRQKEEALQRTYDMGRMRVQCMDRGDPDDDDYGHYDDY